MALLDGLSQVDKAMADTLILKSSGDAFDNLAALYGLPRPSYIHQKYWRKALWRAAFGKRDALGTIFAFLREALRGSDTTFEVTVDPVVSTRRITWTAGGAAAGFTEVDLFRFWEIDGVTYLSVDGDGVFAGGVSPYILLAPTSAPMWAACNWVDAGLPPGATPKTAYRLPFVCRGYNAIVEVFLDISDDTPPTYLQQFWDWALAEVTIHGTITPELELTEAVTLENLRVAEDDLGVVPARGGPYTCTLYLNNAPTALQCVLGAADLTAVDVVHTVAAVAGDKIRALVLADPAATVGLTWPRFSVAGRRPVVQPLGGHLLGDASSDTPGVGPYPIYLSSDDDTLWTDMLGRLVAMGVVVRAKKSINLNNV